MPAGHASQHLQTRGTRDGTCWGSTNAADILQKMDDSQIPRLLELGIFAISKLKYKGKLINDQI